MRLLQYFCMLFILAATLAGCNKDGVTPTRSMEPALKAGDSFTYATDAYRKIGDVQRWDIIVYYHDFGKPQGLGLVVKRAVGLPGDKLEFKENVIILNGSAIKLPSEVVLNYKELNRQAFEYLCANGNSVSVPADCVFAIGDNAVISYDSRFYGPINFEDICGKVISIRHCVKE